MSSSLKCNLSTGKWAPQDSSGGDRNQISSGNIEVKNQLEECAFSSEEQVEIRAAIRDKYRKVSQTAEGSFKYQTGKSGAIALGYDLDIINKYPEKALRSFCGVGNPFSISKIDSGSSVLDIGCGAGFDILVANESVGAKGHVCGIDLSEEMIQQAQALIEKYGDQSISVQHVDSESIPYDDEAFDYVISNGAFNLSPLKAKLFIEIFRVLKPGGTLQFADIVLVEERTPGAAINLEAWAQWIGGAISVRDQLKLLRKAGFHSAEYKGGTGIKTSPQTEGALFKACRL